MIAALSRHEQRMKKRLADPAVRAALRKNVLTMKGVRDRVIVNASVADGRQFKPTSMAIAMVNAALLYDCRGSNA